MAQRRNKRVENVEPITEAVVEETIEQTAAEETTKRGTVIASKLNVRKDASTSSDIVKVLNMTDMIEILGEKEDFYRIKDGYVMKSFVAIV